MAWPEPIALGVGLAIGSALGWSALDALRKRLAAELSACAILLGITAPQVPIHLALTLRTGVPELEPGFIGLTLVAATLTAAANLLFVHAVRVSPLSLTVPYLSFTPVATLAAGVVFLGQVPTAVGVAGVCTVVLGALLLDFPSRDVWRSPWRGLVQERGSRMMLGVALIFAATNTIDRLAILRASEPAYAALLTGSITVVLLTLPALRRELANRRSILGLVVLAGLAAAVALLLQFLSYRFLYVAYVDAVKRAGGNVLAVVLGAALFAEGNTARRLLAAGIMGAGVAGVILAS